MSIIKVDSRVGSKHIYHPLLKLVSNDRTINHTVELDTLEAGDVCWEGNGPEGVISIGAELVKIPDLLQKMETGRLTQEQLPKLLDKYKVVYLIVEGRWNVERDGTLLVYGGEVGPKGWKSVKWRPSGFLYRSVNGFLLSLQTFPRVIVVHTFSDEETYHWLHSTINWWSKPWEDHNSFEAWSGVTVLGSRLTLRKPTLVEEIASRLPGIGAKKVAKVAATFGSVKAMINAKVEDWTGIKFKTNNISVKQAEVIVRSIEEDTNVV